MSAPTRPPSFFNTMTGADTPYPDSLREPRFLIDALAGDVRYWPDWLLDDDSQRPIRLAVAEHLPEQKLVITFTVDKLSGTLTATPDPSGFLHVVVAVGGAEFLTGYVERIWEEHEIWPPGAVAAVGEESPGHLGKHRSWVSISASGWPQLAAITNDHGWLNVRQFEPEATE